MTRRFGSFNFNLTIDYLVRRNTILIVVSWWNTILIVVRPITCISLPLTLLCLLLLLLYAEPRI